MNVVKYLKSGKTVEDLKDDFGIKVKEYDDFYILNYDQIDSPKKHPITIECRSLVLDKNFDIVSRSFDRFFNLGECDEHKNINVLDFDSLEKADGSLIMVYNFAGEWLIRTRGTAYAEAQKYDMVSGEWSLVTYKDLILKTLNLTQPEFQTFCNGSLHEGNTYIFEFIGPDNHNVVRYEKNEMVLLAVRENVSGEYYDLSSLHVLAKDNFEERVRVVNTWKHTSVDDLVDHAKSLPNYQEGFVLWNTTTHERVKVKNPAYVQVHHLKDNGGVLLPKRVAALVWINEYAEILSYFPEYEPYFTPIIDKFERLKLEVNDLWKNVKTIENQKEFALKVKDHPWSAFMFQAKNRGGEPLDYMGNIEADKAYKWL